VENPSASVLRFKVGDVVWDDKRKQKGEVVEILPEFLYPIKVRFEDFSQEYYLENAQEISLLKNTLLRKFKVGDVIWDDKKKQKGIITEIASDFLYPIRVIFEDSSVEYYLRHSQEISRVKNYSPSEFKVGDMVWDKDYGKGEVVNIFSSKFYPVKVAFENGVTNYYFRNDKALFCIKSTESEANVSSAPSTPLQLHEIIDDVESSIAKCKAIPDPFYYKTSSNLALSVSFINELEPHRKAELNAIFDKAKAEVDAKLDEIRLDYLSKIKELIK
jgi:hypothetical protein